MDIGHCLRMMDTVEVTEKLSAWEIVRKSERLGGAVVRALDLQSTGRGFDSRPPHCRVATLGRSFTHVPSTSEVTTVWRCRNSINSNSITVEN